MKKRTYLAAIAAIALSAALPPSVSAAPATPGASAAAPNEAPPAEALAIVFDLQSLVSVASPYDDGYQSGVGCKWWAKDSLAVRGLVGLELNARDGQASTTIGLSGTAEWHPARRPTVSPYAGGLAGLRAVMDGDNRVDLYAGGLAGLELRLFGPVALYAEYRLLAALDADGFTISLGGAGSAQLGLLFYF